MRRQADLGENASGVLYAMGGSGGGLTLYMDKGDLVYEYNMMIIERYITRSTDKIMPGKHKIAFVVGDDRFTYPFVVEPGQVTTVSKDLQ